jgi:hypothetical protein
MILNIKDVKECWPEAIEALEKQSAGLYVDECYEADLNDIFWIKDELLYWGNTLDQFSDVWDGNNWSESEWPKEWNHEP